LLALPAGGDVPAVAGDARIEPGSRLEAIRSAGSLVVATDGDRSALGWSAPDAAGRLEGIDADLARALSVGLFGSPDRLDFVTDVPFADTFDAVARGTVDIAVRNITVNLRRDAVTGVDFSFPYVLTGVRVLAHAGLGIQAADDLGGVQIGAIADTTGRRSLEEGLSRLGIRATVATYDSLADLEKAFAAGAVDAMAADGGTLVPLQERLARQGLPTRFVPGQFSDESLAVVVAEDQSDLLDFIDAVIQILRSAAELGVTQANVAAMARLADADDASLALRWLFATEAASTLPEVGLDSGRIAEIIATTGNLREIIERHISDPDLVRATFDRLIDRPL
jgi:general L-amino acid transport system substrate-binding protein